MNVTDLIIQDRGVDNKQMSTGSVVFEPNWVVVDRPVKPPPVAETMDLAPHGGPETSRRPCSVGGRMVEERCTPI